MHRSAPLLLGFVAIAALTRGVGCLDGVTVDDDNFRSDVLYCENAVAHASACCPAVSAPHDACRHYYRRAERDCGCASDGVSVDEEWSHAVLAIATSRRILDTSCEDLAANAGCEEVARLLAAEHTGSRSTSCSQSSGSL